MSCDTCAVPEGRVDAVDSFSGLGVVAEAIDVGSSRLLGGDFPRDPMGGSAAAGVRAGAAVGHLPLAVVSRSKSRAAVRV